MDHILSLVESLLSLMNETKACTNVVFSVNIGLLFIYGPRDDTVGTPRSYSRGDQLDYIRESYFRGQPRKVPCLYSLTLRRLTTHIGVVPHR